MVFWLNNIGDYKAKRKILGLTIFLLLSPWIPPFTLLKPIMDSMLFDTIQIGFLVGVMGLFGAIWMLFRPDWG